MSPDVVTVTMTSSRSRRAVVMVILLLLVGVAVVNCRQRDSADELRPHPAAFHHHHRHHQVDQTTTRALAAANRRHLQPEQAAPAREDRNWRGNRVRVWGKRTAIDDNNDPFFCVRCR